MSWSASFTLHGENESVPDSVTGDEDANLQYESACMAAIKLIETGLWGDDDKEFFVNISGHSNPNHQPRNGWSNDSVTITISQK